MNFSNFSILPPKKKNVLFYLLFLVSSTLIQGQDLPAQYRISADGRRLEKGRKELKGLYDDDSLRRIDLNFKDKDWNLKLLEYHKLKKDLPATLIADGKSYPDVGVRYKGNSSYFLVPGKKKSFNISMDFTDSSQNLKGYETLHFHNGIFDPSFLKEVFFENLTRKYGPSLQAAFIHLFINGNDWGIYNHIQSPDGEFIKEWFLNNKGSRWRAEPPGFENKSPGLGTSIAPGRNAMNYLGESQSKYEENYTLKRSKVKDPWDKLRHAFRVLDQSDDPDSLMKILDVDRALWFLAKEIVFEDFNGYVVNGGMDYYLYFDEATGRLVPLLYDNNMVMHSPEANWNLFMGATDSLLPLCYKLFNIPRFRQRYLSHVRTITRDLFRDSIYEPLIDRYFKLIEHKTYADKRKLMTNYEFVSAKDSLKTWMKKRRTFILNHPEVNREELTFDRIESDADLNGPEDGQKVAIKLYISGNLKPAQVILHYSPGYDGVYKRINMTDDGKNGDSAANDGIYGASIPGHSGGQFVRFYLEAIANDDIGTTSFIPEGAEHDVYIYRVKPASPVSKDVVINEVMSANTSAVADQDGEYDDWIELYNTSDKTIDISKWILTDNPAIPDKFRIPAGTQIAPKGYLIIWADEDGKQPGLHANFKISASGEVLSLKDANGHEVDRVEVPALGDNQSYTRENNGKGQFVIQGPTFKKNNERDEKINKE